MINKVYLRPNARLPKIIALAFLLEHLRLTQELPEVIMLPESSQPVGDGIYNLDCHGNGYRQRGMDSELEVVAADFSMPHTRAMIEFHHILRDHNPGGNRPKHLDKNWGSIGFFAASAYDLIAEVAQGNWKWGQDLVIDSDGSIVMDDGRPRFEDKAHREKLQVYDFLRMSMDVVRAHLTAKLPKQKWNDGLNSKVVRSILDGQFQGKKVGSGNFAFPTLSGYVRDLYVSGETVEEIRRKLRPWLRLWRLIENCLDEASEINPHQVIQACGWSCAIFDFSNEAAPGYDNPMIHKAHLRKSNTAAVVIRRPSGHVAILTSGLDAESVARFHRGLELREAGLWHLERGGIYNGSKSRMEVASTGIDVREIATMAKDRLVLSRSR